MIEFNLEKNMKMEDTIKKFLEKETQRKIESETENLIEKGVLDSFSMIKFINFIETDLGVKIDMEELSSENFNSIKTIVSTIKKWK